MAALTSGKGADKTTVLVGTDDPGDGWEAFVAGQPTGHLMQSRAWAAVKQDSGWIPLFLRLERNGEVRAAALVLRLGIPGVGLSLLYIPRGPMVDYGDPELVEAMGAALRDLAGEQHAFVVQTDPAVPEEREEAHAALTRMGFRREVKQGLFRISQPLRVMRIPLDRYGGPGGLLAALPEKTRYHIRLAERKGVVIVPRTDYGALPAFHDLLWRTGRRKGFAVRSFKFHEAIWRHCVQAGLGEYLFAEYEGQLVAAIQVLRFGTTAWYMYGSSIEAAHKVRATYLLQWAGISRAWAAGCRCYDMRGVYSATPRPADPEYGVYEFKRRFNAEMVCFLGEYDMVVRPGAYAAWRWLERAAQQPAAWAFRLQQRLRGSR